MTIDVNYYKSYINFNGTNQDYVQELADSYSRQRDSAISPFLIKIASNEAVKIKLNGIEKTALVGFKRIKDALEDSLIRQIQMYPNIMNYGDYVEYKEDGRGSSLYIIHSKPEFKEDTYDECIMKVCNNVLKFKDNNGNILEVPAIINKGIYDINTGKLIITQDNKLIAEVGYSQIGNIKYIKEDMRFVLNGDAWKVTNIDKITKVVDNTGVYIIELESDLWREGKDGIDGLAEQSIQLPPVIPTNLSIQCSNLNNSIKVNNMATFTILNAGVNEQFSWQILDPLTNQLTTNAQFLGTPTGTSCVIKANTYGKQIKLVITDQVNSSISTYLIVNLLNGF